MEARPDVPDAPRPAVLRAAATLVVDAMTVEVNASFNDAGIHPILLKGPSLTTLLYPDGGRTYTDCDLLVQSSEVSAAEAVLARLGFVSTQAGYAPSERDRESSTFVRRNLSGGPGIVDLHWNLHLARDPDTTWAVLRDERDEMTLGGTPVTILSVAARALHVAIHAAQHGLLGPQRYERGGQTGEDLRRALRVIGRSDWFRAGAIAIELGAEDAFAYGLRLEEDGAVLADELGLVADTPELWRFRSPFVVPRGARSLHRLMAAPTLREKAAVLTRAVIPSRARVRRVADSRFGSASLAGAYVEYWIDALRGVPRAIRSGLALRRVGDQPGEARDARSADDDLRA